MKSIGILMLAMVGVGCAPAEDFACQLPAGCPEGSFCLRQVGDGAFQNGNPGLATPDQYTCQAARAACGARVTCDCLACVEPACVEGDIVPFIDGVCEEDEDGTVLVSLFPSG